MTNKKKQFDPTAPTDFLPSSAPTDLPGQLYWAKAKAVAFVQDHINGGSDVKTVEDIVALVAKLDPNGRRGMRAIVLGEVDAIEKQVAHYKSIGK